MADNEMLTGYLAGQSDNNNGGMFGGNGGWIWALLILALVGGGFGFGGGMFGGGMMGGMGMYPMMMMNGMATRADINEGFQYNDLQNGIRGITNGLSDTTYAVNNAINGVQSTLCQGFNGVERNICDLSHQISDCCCTTQRAIDGVNYNLATQTNALQQTMCTNTRDIIDSQQAGTRAILDFLTQDKISSLTAENQALKFAASQSQQNAFITANQQAQTAELIRRLDPRPCPTAAYLVQPPTPVNFPTNNCGTMNFGYSGCGCSCAA